VGSNQQRIEREVAVARRLQAALRAADEGKAAVVAERVVAIWNARRARVAELWFYRRWALRSRPASPCSASIVRGTIDLRRVDRHGGATIESLIPALSCRRCSPHPPFARLVGSPGPDASR
jgi:hypothetical protein